MYGCQFESTQTAQWNANANQMNYGNLITANTEFRRNNVYMPYISNDTIRSTNSGQFLDIKLKLLGTQFLKKPLIFEACLWEFRNLLAQEGLRIIVKIYSQSESHFMYYIIPFIYQKYITINCHNDILLSIVSQTI